jgi:hypothetical protein
LPLSTDGQRIDEAFLSIILELLKAFRHWAAKAGWFGENEGLVEVLKVVDCGVKWSCNMNAHGDSVAQFVQSLDVRERLDPTVCLHLLASVLDVLIFFNHLVCRILVVVHQKRAYDVLANAVPHRDHVLSIGIILVLIIGQALGCIREASSSQFIGDVAPDIVEVLELIPNELIQKGWFQANEVLDDLRHKGRCSGRVTRERLVPMWLKKFVHNVVHRDCAVGGHNQRLLNHARCESDGYPLHGESSQRLAHTS